MNKTIYTLCKLQKICYSKVCIGLLALWFSFFTYPAMAVDGEIEIPIEIITSDIKNTKDSASSSSSSTTAADAKNENTDSTLEQNEQDVQSKEIDHQTREKLRNTFLDNCKNRSSQKEPNSKVHLVTCSISKNVIFQIYYELMVEPDETYERGKNIPLYRHYPKMKNTLCETVEDFNDAGFNAIRILYQYNGSVIQSNYLDLNDCYL